MCRGTIDAQESRMLGRVDWQEKRQSCEWFLFHVCAWARVCPPHARGHRDTLEVRALQASYACLYVLDCLIASADQYLGSVLALRCQGKASISCSTWCAPLFSNFTYKPNKHMCWLLQGCVTGPSVRQQTVFITHGHMDHVGALHLHAAQRGLCNHRFYASSLVSLFIHLACSAVGITSSEVFCTTVFGWAT
jgi:hypothetical protein